MEDPKNNIPIDEYILGRLNREESQAVEKAISEDPELASDAKMEEELLKAASVFGQDQLRQRLKTIFKEAQKEEQKKLKPRFSIGFYLGIAASVAAIVLFIYLLLGSNLDTDAIYAAYYKPYPSSFASRGAPDEENLLKANQLYDEGKYDEAIPLLEGLIDTREEDGQVKLALGVCYLETDDIEKAQNIFQNIRADGILLYKDLAVWYLALSLIKTEEIDSAKMWLQVLADDPDADKNVEAQRLLLELR